MKSLFLYITIIILFLTPVLIAAPGGGGYNGYRHLSALVTVEYPGGSPAAGVDVKMIATMYGSEGNGTEIVYGTTSSGGWVNLAADVYYEGWEEGHFISVSVSDEDYSVLSSSNTSSSVSYTIYPDFEVVFDQDKDSIDDNIELQIAEKFKPVLHRHANDNQPDLANCDQILENSSTLKGYNLDSGFQFYKSDIWPIHVSDSNNPSHFCSFGFGTQTVEWIIDFDNSVRNIGADIGNRPLYYHVYKNGDYYYLQYWYFFTFNDLTDDTEHQTWHEGDWEHVSIKIENDNGTYIPCCINFYQHEGGHTHYPDSCWWSSNNNPAYHISLQQGYDENHTHLHIWIASNSHASYNRYDPVYDFTLSLSLGIGEDHIRDNCDYDPSGWDFYFVYDYLEKLGEISGEYNCVRHNQAYLYHYDYLGNSKVWLAYRGRMGEYWYNYVTSTPSPHPPSIGDGHEYYSHSIDFSASGFGNDGIGDTFFSEGTVSWEPDLPIND